MKYYKIDPVSFEITPVDFRPLWFIPIMIVLAVVVRVLFLCAPIATIVDWRGQKQNCTLNELYNQQK